MNTLEHLNHLALLYAVADRDGKLSLIGQAMQNTMCNQFIALHQHGWNGVAGAFARAIARAISTI